MTREDREQRPGAERATPDIPRERLKDSVLEYRAPFEPVGIEDWEVPGLEDDTTNPGGGA
ncbi:MAG: hypothetical protein ACQEUN_16985 [Pseudomonadota bacterium]